MAQQKISYYGSIVPQETMKNGQGGVISADQVRYDSLADIGRDISNTVLGIARDNRRKQGEMEGLKAGDNAVKTGEAIQEKSGGFPSIYNEAFDKAQKSAYLAGVDRTALDHITRLETENALDPDAFAKKADGYLSGLVEKMPQEYAIEVSKSVRGYISRGQLRISERTIESASKAAKIELMGALDSYSREASRASRNGEDGAVKDMLAKVGLAGQAMVKAGFWQQSEADEALRKARNETTEQAYIQIVSDAPIDDAIKMLDQASKTVPPGFSGDEYDVLLTRARAALQKRITDKKKAEAEEKESFEGRALAVELAVKTGEGDPDEILLELGNLFQKGHYKATKAAGLMATVVNDMKKTQKLWERVGGDKSIVVDHETANKVWRKDIASLPDHQQVQYAASLNMVPQDMQKRIINDIYSGDLATATKAIEMVARMDEFQGFPEYLSAKDRAYIEHITELAPVYGPQKAIDMARERTDPRDKARVEARQAEVKENYKLEDWENGAEKAFGPIFGSLDPHISPQLQRDYQNIFTANYVAGMSESKAKDEAIKQLKRTYSEWNGRPMKFSPDKYYQVDGSSEWIVDEVKGLLTKNIFGAPKIDDFYLISDYATASMANDEVMRPGYLIRYKTKDGWDIYPGRYYPDVDAQRAKKLNENEGLIKGAREKSNSVKNTGSISWPEG